MNRITGLIYPTNQLFHPISGCLAIMESTLVFSKLFVFMNIKLNPIEVGRFLICVGIAWIAWMTHYHTGSIF